MCDIKRYDAKMIFLLAYKKLVSCGLSEDDAYVFSDSMIMADLCGVDTHGIRMLPVYVDKLKSGNFDIGNIKIIKQTPSFTTIDAQNTIGAVSAVKATKIAIDNAEKYGMHTVFAKNCNTYGPAFYYVELMSKKGLIGFTSCNSPSAMPAVNGLETMLGTNPFAFAVPAKLHPAIVIDMATSVVAKSKFQTAKLNNEKLQPGWALDKDGNPTTDPLEAIKGFVLPMAGFKGYGIAMMIDIMSGLLSGAGYLNKVNKFYSDKDEGMNCGQLFVAVNPKLIYDGDFYSEMDEYINILRSSKCVSGKKIILPGDDRVENRRTAEKKGIVLSNDTIQKLEEVFGEKINCI